MSRSKRGWILAAAHVLLALSITGKFLYDRETLPRAWVRTLPYDPNLPLRGRYVRMWVEVDYTAPNNDDYQGNLSLAIVNGRLTARKEPPGDHFITRTDETWRLNDALAYFIPDDVPDPSIRKEGEELWVEVSLPAAGPPRPIRLGVKRNGGEIVPLALD